MQLEIEVMGDGNAFIRSPVFELDPKHTGEYWVGIGKLELGPDYRLEPLEVPGSKGMIRLCTQDKKSETLCVISLSYSKTYDIEITKDEDGNILVAIMIPTREPVAAPA
jgi:hypothetical protein